MKAASAWWGPLSNQASTKAPLAWDPEMDESTDSPPYMLMTNEYFTVYQHRRRRLVSGGAPKGVDGDRPMQAREWRACQNRMNDEPAWERAERYRRMMQENGYRIVRNQTGLSAFRNRVSATVNPPDWRGRKPETADQGSPNPPSETVSPHLRSGSSAWKCAAPAADLRWKAGFCPLTAQAHLVDPHHGLGRATHLLPGPVEDGRP